MNEQTPHNEKVPPLERGKRALSNVVRTFSSSERRIFGTLVVVVLISAAGLAALANKYFMVEVPAPGGTLSEGVIGAPRFINPLLAISDADRDLTALVYSGLLRATPSGKLIGDLAESYTVSENGLAYTFLLKDGLRWHDGKPLTSDDVVFTINKVRDSVLKSPRRASWEGVGVDKVDNRRIMFTLERPYSPFLENATLGILPRHIWEEISSEQFGFSTFNVEPVGSGPYSVKKINRDSSGIPAYYDLVPFKEYALGKPFVSKLRIRFYANEESLLVALEEGEVEAVHAIAPEKARALADRGERVETFILPRVFGVFFNQNQNTIFADKAVRVALDTATDKGRILDEVLLGYGTTLDGPIPPGALGFSGETPTHSRESVATSTDPLGEARAILERNDWTFDEEERIWQKTSKSGGGVLAFSIATSDAEELKRSAELLKKMWEALGANVTVQVFNTGELNQNVIRPRKYDALLFGEVIGRESDPFAFWHSSQRNDPGLNIALYANITTDKLLEDGRAMSDYAERVKIYESFQEEVIKDVPAVFIYSPDFIYIVPERIKGLATGTITVPSERFLEVHKWHIETNTVWKIFK